MCAGQEESHQGAATRKTQEQSAQVSEEAARKTGKDEETLKNMLFVYQYRCLCLKQHYIHTLK